MNRVNRDRTLLEARMTPKLERKGVVLLAPTLVLCTRDLRRRSTPPHPAGSSSQFLAPSSETGPAAAPTVTCASDRQLWSNTEESNLLVCEQANKITRLQLVENERGWRLFMNFQLTVSRSAYPVPFYPGTISSFCKPLPPSRCQ